MSGPYFGKYRGRVIDVDDPLKLGRIRAGVPDIFGENESGWALPSLPFTGKAAGFFVLPGVGSGVWIEFEQGDPDYPIWSGCFWTEAGEVPPGVADAKGKKLVLQTAGGLQILLDDSESGGITLQTSGGQKIVVTSSEIEIDNGKGAKLKLSGSQTSVNDGALEVM